MDALTELAEDYSPPLDLNLQPRDWYSESEIKSMGGMGIFTWLTEKPADVPVEVWNLFCPHKSGVGGWGYDYEHNWWYHSVCQLPRPHWASLFQCENCDEYYRPNYLPHRSMICPSCEAINA